MQTYETLLEISKRVNWRLDDIVGKQFDFSKPFLPEAFARTNGLPFLSAEERLTLNHIRARGYLALFELVEQFVEPFVAHEATIESKDRFRRPALEQFAREETKHMDMFRRVLKEFDDKFGVDCDLIGPAEEIRRAVLGHHPLAVLVLTLHLEWMSQGHYLESVKDDDTLDRQFKSLLKHHWLEECQHARLDGLMLQEQAAEKSASETDQIFEDYLKLVEFFDGGFKAQADFDCSAFERASDRALSEKERNAFVDAQHQALRWTFLGSAMENRNFLEGLRVFGGDLASRVRKAASAYQ